MQRYLSWLPAFDLQLRNRGNWGRPLSFYETNGGRLSKLVYAHDVLRVKTQMNCMFLERLNRCGHAWDIHFSPTV